MDHAGGSKLRSCHTLGWLLRNDLSLLRQYRHGGRLRFPRMGAPAERRQMPTLAGELRGIVRLDILAAKYRDVRRIAIVLLIWSIARKLSKQADRLRMPLKWACNAPLPQVVRLVNGSGVPEKYISSWAAGWRGKAIAALLCVEVG